MNSNNTTKYILAGIVVGSLALILIIWMIWSNPNDESSNTVERKNIYSYLPNKNITQRAYDTYKSEVRRLLLAPNTSQLFAKMDPTYIKNNNLTLGNFENFVKSKGVVGSNVTFTSYTTFNKGDTYIYQINYKVQNGNKTTYALIDIIETSAYQYSLSFEENNFELLKNNVTRSIDGIEFSIVNVENNDNSTKFEITFVNGNEKNIHIDFDDVNSVQLLLNDGNQVKMAATVISADEEILTPKSSLKKEAFFTINQENQSKIKGIIFKNVMIDNTQKEITINF